MNIYRYKSSALVRNFYTVSQITKSTDNLHFPKICGPLSKALKIYFMIPKNPFEKKIWTINEIINKMYSWILLRLFYHVHLL